MSVFTVGKCCNTLLRFIPIVWTVENVNDFSRIRTWVNRTENQCLPPYPVGPSLVDTDDYRLHGRTVSDSSTWSSTTLQPDSDTDDPVDYVPLSYTYQRPHPFSKSFICSPFYRPFTLVHVRDGSFSSTSQISSPDTDPRVTRSV